MALTNEQSLPTKWSEEQLKQFAEFLEDTYKTENAYGVNLVIDTMFVTLVSQRCLIEKNSDPDAKSVLKEIQKINARSLYNGLMRHGNFSSELSIYLASRFGQEFPPNELKVPIPGE